LIDIFISIFTVLASSTLIDGVVARGHLIFGLRAAGRVVVAGKLISELIFI
jgi:hypothetical protein